VSGVGKKLRHQPPPDAISDRCRSNRSAVHANCALRHPAISLDQLAGAPGCFSGCARAKAPIVESELAIRVKFENGAVSTEKYFAPAAWLARQMSASVIGSPWQ
jgi:hypothetical protein